VRNRTFVRNLREEPNPRAERREEPPCGTFVRN